MSGVLFVAFVVSIAALGKILGRGCEVFGVRAGGDEELVFQDRTLVDDKTIIYITLVDEKAVSNFGG